MLLRPGPYKSGNVSFTVTAHECSMTLQCDGVDVLAAVKLSHAGAIKIADELEAAMAKGAPFMGLVPGTYITITLGARDVAAFVKCVRSAQALAEAKAATWSMPEWMEKYRKHISSNYVEATVNNPASYTSSDYKEQRARVLGQIALLEQLHNEGVI